VSLVLDSSVVVVWYFKDAATAETDAVLDRVAGEGAIVPAHWRLDVIEAFQAAIRRNKMDAIYRDASIAELALLPVTIDGDTDTYVWSATLRIADRFSLPIHAASYLELAHRLALPFATLDQALQRAAVGLGIPGASAEARHVQP
jgi:predicted nucleic acid-binding protein